MNEFKNTVNSSARVFSRLDERSKKIEQIVDTIKVLAKSIYFIKRRD